jgi:hypothetical protein
VSRKSFPIPLIVLALSLAHPALAQQLAQSDAADMLNKLGHASAASEFVLSTDQDQQLHRLSKDLLDTLQIQSESPCLLSARDPRVRSHQFVVCQGLFPPGLNPQQPAFDLKLGRTFPWHVVTVTIPDDAPENPQEQLVQYTWEYDFTALPPQLQQILKPAAPRPGQSLFTRDGGAWHWSAYR